MLKALRLARDYCRLALSLPFAARSSKHVPPKKVLFLGYAAVGDLLFLLPALRALREGLPEARLIFVGDDDTGANELLPATGLVDEIWRYTHAHLATAAGRRDIERRIAAEGFDAVVVSQATPLRPFARAILRVPRRIGHVRPIEAPHQGWSAPRYALWRLRRGAIHSEWERRWTLTEPVPTEEESRHAVARNLALVSALGAAVPQPESSRPDLPLSARDVAFAERALPPSPGSITAGIHLGSPRSQYGKLWPAERWGEVASGLAQRGWRIAVVGGADERAALERFRTVYRGPLVDAVGTGRLLESFALISRCDVFLSSDTGLAKAAMCLRVPTFTLWGPVSRLDQGIIWDRGLHRDFSLELACSPCLRMALRREGAGVLNYDNCRHHDCLGQMTAPQVLRAILAWQAKLPRRSVEL